MCIEASFLLQTHCIPFIKTLRAIFRQDEVPTCGKGRELTASEEQLML